MLYNLGKLLSKIYFNVFYRYKCIGAHNIPNNKSVLICSNHIGNLDPPLLGSSATRKVHFMAKSELFEVPILGKLLPKIHAIPVKRGMRDRQALKTGLKILKDGHVVGLFPEGSRGKTGEIRKGLAGAGFFALKSDAAVVPCVIIGPYQLFKPITIIFGEPIDFSKLREEKVSAQEATDFIMDSIKKLYERYDEK